MDGRRGRSRRRARQRRAGRFGLTGFANGGILLPFMTALLGRSPDQSAPSSGAPGRLVYRVDAGDAITWVGPGWLEFARDNDAPELEPSSLLGRPLRTWVAGSSVWQLYALLLQRVRLTGRPLTFAFRCDAPALRRFLTMTMTPLAEHGIEFDSVLTRAESRTPVPLLDRRLARSERFVTLCSWCKRVKVAEGDWREIEAAVEPLRLFGTVARPMLTHGICPSCVRLFDGLTSP